MCIRDRAWIKSGFILLDSKKISSKDIVLGGEIVSVEVQQDEKILQFEAENIPLNIVYEDENLFVINKDKNMVVHPAAGNWSGTILNAILFHFPMNKSLPRCGIVHRLDKDTTGLMVVAKDEVTQSNLIKQLQSKKVFREYRAIVWGQVLLNKSIDLPIGRHPSVRTKMAINKNNGKNAVTHYEVLERFIMHSYLRCKLETGRTHQIRVHMSHNTSPIVGDQTYGLKKIIPTKEISLNLKEATINFPRQALHSSSLGLIHPKTKDHMRWDIDLPEDMKNLLDLIRHESSIST
jgi:23S rRNA pseudouridine1911/1915/1917 synthase